MEGAKRLRRLQFSLRTMLVIMTALSVFFAWLAAEARTVQQRQATIAQIEKQSRDNLFARDELEMFFAMQSRQRGPSIVITDRESLIARYESAPGIPWVRRLLGDQAVYFAVVVNPGDVQRIQSQFPEALVIAYQEVPNSSSAIANQNRAGQP